MRSSLQGPTNLLGRFTLTSKIPSLTTQASWLLVARVIAFALSLAIPLALVRIFDRTQVGTYRQIFLVIGTAVNILPLGFTVSAYYYLPRERERRGLIVLNIVGYLAIVGALACLVVNLYPAVLRLLVGSDALTPYAPLIGLIILLWLFSGLLEHIATANEDVKSSTFFIIAAQLSKTIFILSAVTYFRTISALLYAAAIQGVVESGMLMWYLHRCFPGYWKRFEAALFREQAAYVAPLGLGGIVYSARVDLHNYLVAHNFSVGEYAIYSIGNAQLPLVGTLRDSVAAVLLARVSLLQHQRLTGQIRGLVFRSVRKLSAIYIPVAVCLCVLGRDFIITVYTSKYVDCLPILILNACLLPLNALISDPVLRAYSEYRYTTLKIRIIMLVVLVGLALAGIHYFGMMGAMSAYVLVVAVENSSLFGLSMWILKVKRADWRALADVAKFTGAAICAAIAVLLLEWALPGMRPQVALLSGGVLFSLVYIVVVSLIGAVDREEQNIINRLSSRYLRLAVFRPSVSA